MPPMHYTTATIAVISFFLGFCTMEFCKAIFGKLLDEFFPDEHQNEDL